MRKEVAKESIKFEAKFTTYKMNLASKLLQESHMPLIPETGYANAVLKASYMMWKMETAFLCQETGMTIRSTGLDLKLMHM